MLGTRTLSRNETGSFSERVKENELNRLKDCSHPFGMSVFAPDSWYPIVIRQSDQSVAIVFAIRGTQHVRFHNVGVLRLVELNPLWELCPFWLRNMCVIAPDSW